MALVPVTKEMERQAYLYRFKSWLASRPEEERAYFCEHGRYTGYQSALKFCCPECKTKRKEAE